MISQSVPSPRPVLRVLAALTGVALMCFFPVRAHATFADVSQARGVMVNTTGTLQEDWGTGCAFFDFDNDGDLDLYVATYTGAAAKLYRQEPDGTFTDVAAAAGVADTRNGRAVKVADYDNDGDDDFFLGNFEGPNRLFRNNGDGTFTDVADSALAAGNLTFGACWADYDNDGWVDLYVVNRRRGGQVPGLNQLFHNRGDGTFDEVGAALGVDDEKAGLEAVWFDYDNDRDPDLYLSNDRFGGNRLWRNDGGTFTDVSAASRANVTINSMGVEIGDYDADGDLDLYITNSNELGSILNILLRNNGDGTFDNVATDVGVRSGRWGWGCAFLDYDNDADLDLYVANSAARATTQEGENLLFRNNVVGAFTEVGVAMGCNDPNQGYGVSVADFDGDGALDMFLTNNKAPSVLYRNTSVSGTWLKVHAVGVVTNRSAIGARLRVVRNGFAQIREVNGGSSYLSEHDLVAHFGLGSSGTVDTLEVRWPSGCVDRMTGVAANQTVTVVEGSTGIVEVTSISASTVAAGIRVVWEVGCAPAAAGFRIYRRDTETDEEVLLDTGGALAPAERSWIDASGLVPGRLYEYTVAALPAPGGDEVRSNAAGAHAPGADFVLLQNHPNPFNPGTTLSFSLTEAGPVKLTIHDAAGRLVRTLLNDDMDAGPHDFLWMGENGDGSRVPSGVYFYRLETREGVLMRKMVLLK